MKSYLFGFHYFEKKNEQNGCFWLLLTKKDDNVWKLEFSSLCNSSFHDAALEVELAWLECAMDMVEYTLEMMDVGLLKEVVCFTLANVCHFLSDRVV